MAEGETLKLPKPLPGSDFLTFPTDRRWDLLGFVKSDEIEEIKSCEVGPDGHRYYLMHWKDSWKPESSLIYCDKLLQEFWLKKSLIQQQDLLPDSSSKLVPNNGAETDIEHTKHNSLLETDKNDTVIDITIERGDNEILHSNTGVPSVVCDIQANKHVHSVPIVRKTETCNQQNPKEISVETEKEMSVDCFERITGDSTAVLVEDNAIEKIDIFDTKTHQVEENYHISNVSEDTEEIIHVKTNTINSTSKINVLSETSTDSPSKKGAPKRKARPPRQSVQSMTDKKKDKTTKDKPKDKPKKTKVNLKKSRKIPKISKTASAVVDTSTRISSTPLARKATLLKVTSTEVDNNSKLKCMVCDKFLASEQSLMKHLLTHNNNHTCTVCMKTFKSTHFLKHHMDKHNTSYQYSCPVCSKKFKFKNNMRGHLRKHNMEKKFECDICQKKFIGRYNLREHMKSHSDNRPFECDFCHKAYKDRGALNKHMLTHQEKKVECEICNKPFTNAAQVKRHMQFHYSWPGDSFKRKTNVGPDGERLKYNCPHCDKTFNHYSNMNAHIHKKHIEKKIKCTVCPKMFAYQYELREHMFIHEGGENSKYKCQYCDKTFQRSTTLKNHERTTHLGIKKFKCEVCGKLFGTKFNMKVHVKKLHAPGVSTQTKSKRTSASKPVTSTQTQDSLLNPLSNISSFSSPITTNGLPTHALLRNFNTTDIIRNAMSNIPELGYFQPLQPPHSGGARGFQFYGMSSSDFGVS